MDCRIKRVDPYWLQPAALSALALAAGAVTLFAAQAGRTAVALIAGAACVIAFGLATKPALSGVFAVFGLLGGAVTFLASPDPGLSPLLRVLATAGFTLFYMALMDGVVLAVCAIYNLFTRAGFAGFSLRLDAES